MDISSEDYTRFWQGMYDAVRANMKQMKDIVDLVGCKMAQAQYWVRIVPELQKPREKGKATFYSLEDLKIFRIMKLLTDEGFPPTLAAKFIHAEAWDGVIKKAGLLQALEA